MFKITDIKINTYNRVLIKFSDEIKGLTIDQLRSRISCFSYIEAHDSDGKIEIMIETSSSYGLVYIRCDPKNAEIPTKIGIRDIDLDWFKLDLAADLRSHFINSGFGLSLDYITNMRYCRHYINDRDINELIDEKDFRKIVGRAVFKNPDDQLEDILKVTKKVARKFSKEKLFTRLSKFSHIHLKMEDSDILIVDCGLHHSALMIIAGDIIPNLIEFIHNGNFRYQVDHFRKNCPDDLEFISVNWGRQISVKYSDYVKPRKKRPNKTINDTSK
ncbi:MAG: hypothetical protein PHF63_00020 [Herbinix sp.]|nr:hypothetical protein [Herbinix sp.]